MITKIPRISVTNKWWRHSSSKLIVEEIQSWIVILMKMIYKDYLRNFSQDRESLEHLRVVKDLMLNRDSRIYLSNKKLWCQKLKVNLFKIQPKLKSSNLLLLIKETKYLEHHLMSKCVISTNKLMQMHLFIEILPKII